MAFCDGRGIMIRRSLGAREEHDAVDGVINRITSFINGLCLGLWQRLSFNIDHVDAYVLRHYAAFCGVVKAVENQYGTTNIRAVWQCDQAFVVVFLGTSSPPDSPRS